MMAIEVKQLTINTSIISGEEQSTETANTADDNNISPQQGLSDACLNIEEIKADIINECQRLIRNSFEMKRER